MSKDTLIVIGVVLIVLVILGSTYLSISRGVAPDLLGESASSKTKSASETSGGTTKTSSQKAPFEFSKIFLKTTSFRVTYDLLENLKKEGSVSLYLKGDKRRFDVSRGKDQAIIINLPDKTILCTKQEQWQCFEIPTAKPKPGEYEGAPPVNDPVSEGKERFKKPVYNGTRKYAGKTCYCYYVTSSENRKISGKNVQGTVTVEICVTSEGIPAYYLNLWKSKDGKTTERYDIIAKTITTTVPDSVFNPPAEPQKLPSS